MGRFQGLSVALTHGVGRGNLCTELFWQGWWSVSFVVSWMMLWDGCWPTICQLYYVGANPNPGGDVTGLEGIK